MSIVVVSNEPKPEVKAEEQKETKSAPESKETPEQKLASNSESEETEEQEEIESKGKEESDEDSDESDDSSDDKPKKKSGYKRRIDKLNARVAEREAKLTAREQELEYWKSQAMKNGATETPKQEPKVEAKPVDEGKPNPDDYESHADFVIATTEWMLDKREKEAKAKEEKSKLLSEQEKLEKAHFDREKAFAEKTEDYAEVMEDAGYLKDASQALSMLIVNSENGPELMYELAKNKAEYERINKLSPLAAAREIGKLEAKLSKPSEEPKQESKKITKAPKPIEPVGGSKGGVAKSIYDPDLSQAEFERLRAEERKRKAASF